MRKAKIGIVSLLILTMILSMLPITALATYSADEDTVVETELLEPAGDAEQAEPAGDAEQAEPVGDAEQAEPAGDAEQTEPAGDAEQAEPADDAEQAEPADDAEQTEPADDAEQTEPAGDAEQTEPAVEVEPVDTPTLYSMMPLKEVKKTLDLTAYLPHELEAFPVSKLQELLGMQETPVVYAKRHDDDYAAIDPSGTIDLYGDPNRDTFQLEVIGGTADPLDPNNVRYIVTVKITPLKSLFVPQVYTHDRKEITVIDRLSSVNTYHSSDGRRFQMLFIGAIYDNDSFFVPTGDGRPSRPERPFYLGLELNSVYENVHVKASTLSSDVTSMLFGQTDMSTSGGLERYMSNGNDINFVLWREGESKQSVVTLGFTLESYQRFVQGHEVCADVDGARRSVWYTNSVHYDLEKAYDTNTVMLQPGFPANAKYFFSTHLDIPESDAARLDHGLSYVKKAVAGYYASEADIPSSAADIKEQLFSDAYNEGGGYAADFSKGVTFTIVDTDGVLYHYALTVIAYDAAIAREWGVGISTYFSVYGAMKAEAADGTRSYASRSMPYEADSYYLNGYRTVFLMDKSTDSETGRRSDVPVTASTICPDFYISEGEAAYASVNGSSAVKQVSGVTEIPFTSGKAIPYSVTAMDGEHVGNYWVTFLTQQAGPKLFVNATNNEAHYATVDGQRMPQREVFLNREYNHRHDIFFANIGDRDIEGLYVRLENAQNVKLDDYWTVGNTKTLSAFTTTESLDPDGNYVYEGNLANFAKVRLVPENDELGLISGTLVIGYTGSGTTPVEEVRINLTGIAGDPMITTRSVVDGVKFVPYSSVIQTNSLHGGMAFSVTEGALPDGLTLKSNGEIYGIPTKTGKYRFTVKAVYNKIEKTACEQTYYLTIQDNTDENVLAVNESSQGYKLLDAVDKELNISNIPSAGVLFRSEGAFGDFVAFFLDGKKLVKGTDYDADEGSTRITIRAQTFKNAGNGTHTIAAEFRAGGQADGEMKKTAQNVTVTGTSSSGGNSGGNSGGGNYGGGSYESSNVTTGATTLDVVTAEAKRIANGNMNYVTEIRAGAIKEALAQGHGITVGVEQRIISRGEVPSDDLTLIDKRLSNTGSADTFLEILVVIRDGTTGELLGYVTQTSSNLQFTIDVPQYMLDAQKQGKYIYVMRVHGGKAEFLSTSIKDGKATFSANKFSTYTLVLMDRAVSGVRTDDAGIMTYTISAAVALAGVGVLTMRRRKQCREREQ